MVVSGPPGSGKTTLAHAIASGIPCPAIYRDEIKEGIVHAAGGLTPHFGDPVTMRTFETFFEVLHVLLGAGTTVVAEAAFQHGVWEPKLRALTDLAEIRVVHCAVEAAVARDRIVRRLAEEPHRRGSHPDAQFLERIDSGEFSFEDFDPLSLDAPRLVVDTTDGYDPPLGEILAFIDGR